ncbi:MAG: hypothetical protein R3320_02450, partial [Nitriliruptorales bacterium]|nr:hypothetical protein [Nitriliruptorales bacterium]
MLAAAGLTIGHERVFGPETERFSGFGGRDGDASWLAVPFVDQLPDEVVVVHQVRHPAAVVGSLLGIRFFAERSERALQLDAAFAATKYAGRRLLATVGLRRTVGAPPRSHRRYRSFVAEHLPDAWRAGNETDRALTYWVGWNRRLERSGRVTTRERVED